MEIILPLFLGSFLLGILIFAHHSKKPQKKSRHQVFLDMHARYLKTSNAISKKISRMDDQTQREWLNFSGEQESIDLAFHWGYITNLTEIEVREQKHNYHLKELSLIIDGLKPFYVKTHKRVQRKQVLEELLHD